MRTAAPGKAVQPGIIESLPYVATSGEDQALFIIRDGGEVLHNLELLFQNPRKAADRLIRLGRNKVNLKLAADRLSVFFQCRNGR